MNNEIKEILDKLKKQIEYPTITDLYCELGEDECKSLLDCITNLQEENERLQISLEAQEELTMNEYYKKNDYKSRNEKALQKIDNLIEIEKGIGNYERFFGNPDFEVKKLNEIKSTLKGDENNGKENNCM